MKECHIGEHQQIWISPKLLLLQTIQCTLACNICIWLPRPATFVCIAPAAYLSGIRFSPRKRADDPAPKRWYSSCGDSTWCLHSIPRSGNKDYIHNRDVPFRSGWPEDQRSILNGTFCSTLSTRVRSQKGIGGDRGGFNLLAPLRNLMTMSCFPTN